MSEWQSESRPPLPGAAPARAPAGRRRAARTLFSPPPALVAAAGTLAPHSSRTWTVSARVPEGAPPSFAGAAASYRWAWRAGARFCWAPPAGADGGGAEDGGGGGGGPGARHHHHHQPPAPPARPYGWLEAGAAPATIPVLPPHPLPGVAPPPGGVAAGAGADPAPPARGFDGAAAAAQAAAALVVVEEAAAAPWAGGRAAPSTAAAAPGQWRPAAPAAEARGDNGGALFMSLSPARGAERRGVGGGVLAAAAAGPPTPPAGAGGGGATPAATPPPPGLPPPATARAFSLRVAGVEAPPLTLTLHADPEGQVTPGRVLRGCLDFSALHAPLPPRGPGPAPHPRCVFYAVALECVEAVAPEWAAGGGRRGFSEEEGGGPPPAALTVADEAAGATAHLLTAHFALCLPVRAAPSLATPLVSVRWRLRFEFCCEGREGVGGQHSGLLPPARGWFGGGGGGGAGPGRPPPPPIEWTLPVLVLPAGSGEEWAEGG